MGIETIIAETRPMPLVRGKAAEHLRGRIAEANVPEPARAGLYLHAGFWDEAHEIAQSISTTDGSYWHAIVHRQEPDAGNAGYWFHRVGAHPIFPVLAKRAAEIDPAFDGPWDPIAFVDYCENGGRDAVEIQEIE